MPTLGRLEELRADAFAEDVDFAPGMDSWTEAQCEDYFASGGISRPPTDSQEVAAGASTERSESSNNAQLATGRLASALAALELSDVAVRAVVAMEAELVDLLGRKDNRGVLERLKTAGVSQLGLRQKVVNEIQIGILGTRAEPADNGSVCDADGCRLPTPAAAVVAPPAPAPGAPPPEAAVATAPAVAAPAAALPPEPAPVLPPEPAPPEKCVLHVRCVGVTLKLTLSGSLYARRAALERCHDACPVMPW